MAGTGITIERLAAWRRIFNLGSDGASAVSIKLLDEVERLQAENARLRGLLRELRDQSANNYKGGNGDWWMAILNATCALNPNNAARAELGDTR